MKAIILAAGEGKRMRPLTLTTPKPLLRVKDKPIIEYVFDALPPEITEVVVVVRYLGEQIKNYLGSEFKGRKIFFAEGSDKGTAYSFLAARDFFAKDERFLFFYGDVIMNPKDVENCLKKELGVIVFKSLTPELHGIVSLGDDGAISEVIEKPKRHNSNMGAGAVMVLNGEIFDCLPEPNEKGEYYFTSLLNKYVKNYKVWPVESVGYMRDLTTSEDIKKIEKDFDFLRLFPYYQ